MAKGGKALSSNDLRLSRYAFTTDQLIRVYSDDAGYMNLAGEPHRSVLTRLYWAEEQIGMEVETRLSNADKLKTAYFELKGESSSLTMPPVTGKINVQGSSVTAAAIIPICDEMCIRDRVSKEQSDAFRNNVKQLIAENPDNTVTKYLESQGIQTVNTQEGSADKGKSGLDVMIATHPHYDHIGGFIPVMNRYFGVNTRMFWGAPFETDSYYEAYQSELMLSLIHIFCACAQSVGE